MIRLLLATAVLTASGARAEDAAPPGPLPQGVVPTRYDLTRNIDPRKETFSGHTDIEVTLRAPQQIICLGQPLRSTSGGEVQVDRALESIDDCIALRAAVGDSISATLAKQFAPPLGASSGR